MDFFIPCLAIAAVLWRLMTLPGRKLPWFTLYLGISLLRGLWLWHLFARKNAYMVFWTRSEPVIDLLWFAMALELYGRISEMYPGMSRPAWAAAALAVATAVTMLTLIEPHKDLLQNVVLFRRASATIVTVAIMALALLFWFFRNNIPPNLVRHAGIMAVYLATQAIAAFEANLTGQLINWSKVGAFGSIACYLAWAFFLTPAGQDRPKLSRTKSDEDLGGVEAKLGAAVGLASSAGRRNTRD